MYRARPTNFENYITSNVSENRKIRIIWGPNMFYINHFIEINDHCNIYILKGKKNYFEQFKFLRLSSKEPREYLKKFDPFGGSFIFYVTTNFVFGDKIICNDIIFVTKKALFVTKKNICCKY